MFYAAKSVLSPRSSLWWFRNPLSDVIRGGMIVGLFGLALMKETQFNEHKNPGLAKYQAPMHMDITEVDA